MTEPRPRPFWRRPDRGHFLLFLRLAVPVGLWFALVFYGADWVTGLHPYRVRVHLDWETAIPFVPAVLLVYTSMYSLFALPPFVLHTRRALVDGNPHKSPAAQQFFQ